MKLDNSQLNKAIDELKGVTMSHKEKSAMKAHIMSSKPSPYLFMSFYAHKIVYSVAVMLFVFVTGGGSAAFASLRSLPGDTLYPLKVKVVEPVTAAFIFSPEKRAEYGTTLAINRLVEAETLSKENRLDVEKEEELKTLLSIHADTLNKNVEKIRKSEKNKDADTLVVNFQAKVTEHATALEQLTKLEADEQKAAEEEVVPEDPTLAADIAPDEGMTTMMLVPQNAVLRIDATSLAAPSEEDFKEVEADEKKAKDDKKAEEVKEKDEETEKVEKANTFLKKILDLKKKDRKKTSLNDESEDAKKEISTNTEVEAEVEITN